MRADIQEAFIREQEVPPAEYYPEGYHPQLLTDWPADEDLVIPTQAMPPQMLAGVGAAWRHRQALQEAHRRTHRRRHITNSLNPHGSRKFSPIRVCLGVCQQVARPNPRLSSAVCRRRPLIGACCHRM